MRAAIVISDRHPDACGAMLIETAVRRSQGALALRWTGERFERAEARPSDIERPWTGPARDASKVLAPIRSAPDATPREQDLDVED